MNVLSLFDGMSCGQLALSRAGIKYDNYYASEIDKHAIAVTQANYPSTIQLGSVSDYEKWDIDWSKVGLVTAGFPCQSWSVAGSQLGSKDPRGQLFWTTLDIISKVLKNNPKAKFLMENVKMKKEFENYITHHTENALGRVNKILINSALVSAQNRKRFYWTNIESIKLPEDKGVVFKDILEEGTPFCFSSSGIGDGRVAARISDNKKAHTLTATGYSNRSFSGSLLKNLTISLDNQNNKKIKQSGDKANTLTYSYFKGIDGISRPIVGVDEAVSMNFKEAKSKGLIRQLTPIECERLQTVPDNYTNHVSKSQRYKMLGNGWTVDVVAHIFRGIE